MKKIPSAAAFALGCSFSFAAVDLEPLTYDKQVWQSPPQLVSQNFPELRWQRTGTGVVTQHNDLALFGRKIKSAKLSAYGEKNTLSLMEFTVIDSAAAKEMKSEDFTAETFRWKQLIDKQAGSAGKRMASLTKDGVTFYRTAWNFPDAVLVLSANRSTKPDSLKFQIFSKASGYAYLNKKGTIGKPPSKPPSDGGGTTPPPATSNSVIAKALKGHTSYLSGGRYQKKNIAGAPEFYILYFSASW